MSPEEKARFEAALAKVEEIHAWMQARHLQQLTDPVDDASLIALKLHRVKGLGSTALTQAYAVSGGLGGSVTGPKAYSDTVLLQDEFGDVYEVPFVAKNP